MPDQPFPDGLWTITDLSRYLSLSESTIRKRMKDSELPHFYVGSSLRFRRDEVDAWIESQSGSKV